MAVPLLMALSAVAAHDFSIAAPTGQMLYFSYTTGGVALTFPANTTTNTAGWTGYTKPSGALTIPATVTYGGQTYNVVGIYKFAFYGCTGLTSLVVPEGVATIRQAAFSGCTSLTSVELPSTLDSLGNTAFYDCPLTTLTCNALVPPAAGNTAFGNVPVGSCTLMVPCNLVVDYSITAPWNAFTNIVSSGCTAAVALGVNNSDRGTVSGAGTYALGTAVVINALPFDGYFFACWNDGDTLNPRVVPLTGDTSFTAIFIAYRYDTFYVAVHDTVYDTVYDTQIVHDTLMPTFFNLHVMATAGGVGVGSATLPAGSDVEIAALPLEGYRFSAWHDGSTDNPRRITLTSDTTYTADFETVGIGSIENEKSWTLVAEGRLIVVGGARGEHVALYDLQGRRLFAAVAEGDRLVMQMTAGGIYLVTVGNGAAHKIVVE